MLKQVSKTCYKVEDLPANRRKRIWHRFNVHISQMRRYFPRREVDWLPEEIYGGGSGSHFEPSGGEQFESSNGQNVEPSGSEQFEPKQLPVPYDSRTGRVVRPKTSDKNFIYY